MPTSEKQRKFMCAVEHGMKPKKGKVSKKVAKEMCHSKVKKHVKQAH